MDDMNDIRELLRSLDIGRQYIRYLRKNKITTIDRLEALSKSELNRIFGDDLDGSAETLWEWIEENKDKEYVPPATNKTVVIIKDDRNDRNEKRESRKVKNLKYLEKVAKKIQKSKHFVVQNKTFLNKMHKNVINGRKISKSISFAENIDVKKANEVANDFLDEGFIICINKQSFKDNSNSYYKFYINDNFEELNGNFFQEKNLEAKKEEIINSSVSKISELTAKSCTKIENDFLYLEDRLETMDKILNLAQKGSFLHGNYEYCKDEYTFIKYIGNILDNLDGYGVTDNQFDVLKDEREIDKILNVEQNNDLSKSEKSFLDSYQKQCQNFAKIDSDLSEIEKIKTEIEEIGLKIPVSPENFDKIDFSFQSFAEFEDKRIKKIEKINTIFGDYKIDFQLGSLKMDILENKNLFVVLKHDRVIRRTNIAHNKKGKFHFKLKDFTFSSRKRLLFEEKLVLFLKTFENNKCETIASTEIKLKKFIFAKEEATPTKSVSFKNENEKIGKLKIKVRCEKQIK